MKFKFKFNLTAQILTALILGFVVGMLLQNNVEFANLWIMPFGTIFLNMLKFSVVPLVLFSIMTAIVSMKDIATLGRLGGRALSYFIITTILAAVIGLIVPTLLKDQLPIVNIITESAKNTVDVPNIEFSLMGQLLSFFPKNIIDPLLHNNMMQVIVIAVLFGIGIVRVGDKGLIFKNFIISANEVTLYVLKMIMAIAPFGVFCLLCPVVAANGSKIFGTYAALIGMDYFCFIAHALLIFATSVWFLGGMKPGKFFKGMSPAMLFAFSSDSSLATLPVNARCTQELGVRKEVTEFVLPLGATINMNGVAIYLGVTSVFIANCCGIQLDFGQYLAIAFTSTVASIGTPGIPGGSLAMMAMVFASAGIPVEGVAIAAGIDRLVDMGRTTMSITGDAACAVILDHLERKSNRY